LNELLKKHVIFTWTSTTEEAFQLLKHALLSAPVLALPNFKEPIVVEIDVSDYGVGAVLQQNGHPIAFVSKALGQKKHKACLLMKRRVWPFYWQ
jgi:hypothetical protein